MKKIWVLMFLTISIQSSGSVVESGVELVVLGVAQDAGYPQLNCYKPHCKKGWDDAKNKKYATSLGLIDRKNQQKYLFEATPDIREQMHFFHGLASDEAYGLKGVFLTHGHIGHYTGLMHFGHEAAGTDRIPVFVMPRFKSFLENNGPWSQLVKYKNILLQNLTDGSTIALNDQLKVTPFLVPHRDEYTETVGYKITGPNKTVLFIPDINKWDVWEKDIAVEIAKVDYAFLDATFFKNGETPGRDMSEIPHPFVEESMALLKHLSPQDKSKVVFIHFNHTNPLIEQDSDAAKKVTSNGFKLAYRGMKINL